MKNNTPFKLFLRFWIALTSIIAFIASWIVLGHTGKPVSASAVNGGASSSSVQNSSLGASQLAPLPQQQFSQPNFNFAPRFRTRGS